MATVGQSDRQTDVADEFPYASERCRDDADCAIAATEAGIEVCAPIHDAFLITAPLERLDNDVRRMCEIMSKGRLVRYWRASHPH